MSASVRRGQMARPSARIEWRIEESDWRGADLALLRKAAKLALVEAGMSGSFTVLLTSDDQLCALNKKFRGKPGPTNVLSFPAEAGKSGYLGDIAVAFGVTRREAAAGGKSFAHHAAHLVVHGVLHLLGYDHQIAREARKMEGLEVAVLKRMGIGDPYAIPAVAD